MLVENRRLRIRDGKLVNDMRITLTVESEEEQEKRILGNKPLFKQQILGKSQEKEDTDDMIYKGYRIKQNSNGEFDIYSPGGALIQHHVASIELVQNYINKNKAIDSDSIYDIVKKQGTYWIKKAEKLIGYYLIKEAAQKAIENKDFSLMRNPDTLNFIYDINKDAIVKIKCAWCGKLMGEKEVKELPEGLDISHSICKECKEKYFGKK